MKKKIINLYNKYPKYFKIAGVILCILFLLLCSWKLVFVKYKEFHDNESKFKKAAKRYYEFHKQLLPKKGESRELTLQDLYDLDMIDDLYAPNSRKMCDVDKSWVRVYIDENDEYEYYAYLKCGRYQSKVDHVGPDVTLNGDTNITLALNSEYEELGVKKVYDNKDKEMDVTKVVIDSSKINNKKVGTYPVTYTIKDSHYNKTVVTRNVTVTKSLTETVKSSASSDGYYKGNSNNYVLFSGMLWNIVNVNEDGTVRLILHNAVSNLRMNYEKYSESSVNTWLQEIFYKALNNPDNYVVLKDYCTGSINSIYDYGNYCADSINAKVALLDIESYLKTFDGNSSSIFTKSFALSNKIGNNYGDATFNDTKPDGTTTAILAPIRPVITVNNKLSIMSGNGSITKPYKLNDYNYASRNDKINTRLIGEYVEYSGLTFRVIGFDKDNNVRVIMANEWTIKPDDTPIYISTSNLNKWNFNLEDSNSPAYVLNNDYLDYIGTKDIVDTEYDIPINDSSISYDKYKTTKVKAKILLPKTYELFAASGNTKYMYTYIDSSTNDTSLFAVNSSNGKVFELDKSDFESYAIKALITLKGDLKIKSGNGTVNNPYKFK